MFWIFCNGDSFGFGEFVNGDFSLSIGDCGSWISPSIFRLAGVNIGEIGDFVKSIVCGFILNL